MFRCNFKTTKNKTYEFSQMHTKFAIVMKIKFNFQIYPGSDDYIVNFTWIFAVQIFWFI